MKVLIIDNYDSFTYNLFHYAEPFCSQLDVSFNDQINFDQIHTYDKIILSPGPGLPRESGDLLKLIDMVHQSKPILGVCLGQQAIAEYFGGNLFNMERVLHGKESGIVVIDDANIFKNLPNNFQVGRYHSWSVAKESLPPTLKITAVDKNGFIMAMKHSELPIETVQFHPESIMTEYGKLMIENWIKS